ncbi:MAG: hypothetical protein KatS3mg105_1645 [Gemmatales bacterium]|nr:MAG: hypothetical protein KatS3mg105_1645 [Gemmatales bacterium]
MVFSIMTAARTYLKREVDRGVVVLTLLTPQLQSDELAKSVHQELMLSVASIDEPRVVLDFEAVKTISATGLRSILNFRKYIRQRQGRLLLCGLSFEVADVFFTTRVVSTSTSSIIPFAISPDKATAVSHLNQTDSAR